MAIGMIMVNIPLSIMLQKSIPNNIIRGRIIGLFSSLVASTLPFGLILSGIIGNIIQIQLLPIISGVLLIASLIYMSRSKEMKNLKN